MLRMIFIKAQYVSNVDVLFSQTFFTKISQLFVSDIFTKIESSGDYIHPLIYRVMTKFYFYIKTSRNVYLSNISYGLFNLGCKVLREDLSKTFK